MHYSHNALFFLQFFLQVSHRARSYFVGFKGLTVFAGVWVAEIVPKGAKMELILHMLLCNSVSHSARHQWPASR